MSNAEGQMVLVGENATGYQLTLTNGKDNNSVTRFTYGDTVTPSLSRMSNDTKGLQKVTNATVLHRIRLILPTRSSFLSRQTRKT